MSTITSSDRALDLPAQARGKGVGRTLLAGTRILLAAIGDGLSAAHDYQELTSRGMAPSAAAQRVFADHFAAR